MSTRVLLLGLFVCCTLAAPVAAKDDESKQVKRAARKASVRCRQWFAARLSKRLLKKGSGLKARRKTIREQAVAAAFLGFAPPAYQKRYKRKAGQWVGLLFKHGKQPVWNKDPVVVGNARISHISVHRDAVSIDSVMTYHTRKQEVRGLRTVWVKPKQALCLSLRFPPRFDKGQLSHLGPATSSELFKTGMAKSMLTANGLLLEVEKIRGKGKDKSAAAKVEKLSVADFGEVAEVDTTETVVLVRCGYMLARVVYPESESEVAATLKPGQRVLFSGDVTKVNLKNLWQVQRYDRGGKVFSYKCVRVTIKGSVAPRP